MRSSAVAELTGSSILAPVHEHELDARLEQRVVEAVVAARRGGDDPVDLPGPHRLRVEQLALGIVVGVGDQRRVPRRLQAVLDAAQDRREERVREVRDQHADRVRAVRLQPARDRIRLVAELLGRLEHAPRGLLVHERPRLLVQRSGYRGRVDARHARDISQRHSRARSSVRRSPSTSIMHTFAGQSEPLTDTALPTTQAIAGRRIGARAAAPARLPCRVDRARGLAARDLDEHRRSGHRDRGAVRLPDADRSRPDRQQRAGRAAGARHGVDGRHRRPAALCDRLAGLDADVGRCACGADSG